VHTVVPGQSVNCVRVQTTHTGAIRVGRSDRTLRSGMRDERVPAAGRTALPVALVGNRISSACCAIVESLICAGSLRSLYCPTEVSSGKEMVP
jgi:hypothetical protein